MLRRMRNANQANPTTGKKEAEGAGGGVVDFAWHPNPKVGVMAVAGGDRRVRFFNVSRTEPCDAGRNRYSCLCAWFRG